MIPGWPYSVVAALEPGRTSWTAVLDALLLRNLGPGARRPWPPEPEDMHADDGAFDHAAHNS
jgi:hypothetical protein